MRVSRVAIACVTAAGLSAGAWLVVRSHRRSQSRVFTAQTPAGPALDHSNTQSAEPSTSAAAPAVSGSTQSQNKLGPFSIAGQNYTVELQTKKIQPGPTGETGDTVVAMEIRDSTASVLYRKEFPYENDANADFSESWSVSAVQLKGTHGSGILVSYDQYFEPSAPEEEPSGWFQVFGVRDGKFTPFGPAYLVQGDLLPQRDPGKGTYVAERSPDGQSDIVKFKVWTGHCRLIFPVRVDWAQGKLYPAVDCANSAGATSTGCRYDVLPEDQLSRGDLTFVRLWPVPDERSGKPEKTVVKKDSKIELVTAQVATAWSDTGDAATQNAAGPMGNTGGFGVPANSELWLKVRIDGKEGWMHSEEDFRALGLPEDE